MSRKEPSFGQLLAYVSRDASDSRYELRHNILATDMTTLTAEYEDNSRLLPKRKNGVVMYHEIISITRAKSLAVDVQKEILRDIALDYLKQRAPKSLAYGSLHDDKAEQLHFHLVISANGLGSTKRHRLERKEFRQIQVGLEARVLARYPQLGQSLAIGKKAKPRTLSQAGVDLKRRVGVTPQKDALKSRVARIFATAQGKDDLFAKLTDAGLELYRRGNSIGIRHLDRGRNHRLSTLGLVDEFNALSARIEAGKAPSLNRAAANPLHAQQHKVIAAVRTATTRPPTPMLNPSVAASHANTPPPRPTLSESDRIAQERLNEMRKLRADQEQQLGANNSSQAKR